MHKQELKTVNRPLTLGQKFTVATAMILSSPFALAADPVAPETTGIVTYAGLIVAAVGVVGAAILMVPLAAKGFKWIKSAF